MEEEEEGAYLKRTSSIEPLLVYVKCVEGYMCVNEKIKNM